MSRRNLRTNCMVYLGRSAEREMYFGAKPVLFKLASEMRKNPTQSEKILWNILRKYRHKGFLFRQQHPICIFIADFYCHRLRLVVEVDGEIHFNNEAQEHDDWRTGVMEKFGIHIIRFTNDQVLHHQDIVINQINELLFGVASPALPGAGDGRG
jgi:very-short-patch-repair endonuclease